MELQAIKKDLHEMIDNISDAKLLNELKEIIQQEKKEKPLLLQELEEAVHNLNLVRAGKMKAKTLDELLDEL